MKRISLMSTLGALAVALLLPASTSAHSAPAFWSDVLVARCTNEGGQHGFGKVVLGMEGYAFNDYDDSPTPNYIVVVGKHQQKIDGVWETFGRTTATSPIYSDGHPYVFSNMLKESISFESADHPKMRMLMRVEFWDDLPATDVRLGSISARTEAC